MRNRTILILLLLLLASYLVSKYDLITQAKIMAANIIYGEELRKIKGFLVVVEQANAGLKTEGLSDESIRQELISRLERGGIKILREDEWKKVPTRPVLHLKIITDKNKESLSSVVVTLEVTTITAALQSSAVYSAEKEKTIWLTSSIGEGGNIKIREKIDELTKLFLKTYSGK
jgi:hypothetical protein